MNRYIWVAVVLAFSATITACNRNKPKPVSSNITKTTVLINGKKDSVLNNVKKNYGNATVSDPCVKCLIQVVQGTDEYKKAIAGIVIKDIIYNINWAKPESITDSANARNNTSALKVDVVDKGQTEKKLLSFMYDNSAAKLYLLKYGVIDDKKELKIDDNLLKRIRNACYWGVASGN